jgi:alkylation response protein AidB-like acyl-CoA dehydrogenase
MGTYRAPVEDMQFLIDELCDIEKLESMPVFEGMGLGPDLTTALLDESARLCGEVLAPLRRVGDEQPATCKDGRVYCSPGFEDAFRALGEGGWAGISAPVEFGGQGLPEMYTTAACEMWNGANMAFALAPFLSIGAALAIRTHGSDEQRATYLEKMYTGQWAGTMNLTESGAGSDLGVMKAKAVPEGDHYRIYGQKIYITWGDHEATDNIVHLVLAKLPDAPQGSRGISLFIVPKFLVNEDGSLGERNDAWPVSTEHKLGIHGSPTCVMAFGDNDGAIGYLLGEENQGLRCMFTMMNEARLKVGLQGLGAADGAYQKAVAYARERVQGGVPIIRHPDVKRMLLTMKAMIEAMRAFAYSESITMDRAHFERDAQQQARIDMMIPVIKGWLTEAGEELTSLGVQVHGGMGYIEESGAAQYLRDVRITSIYEGTNGIQAADLVTRKVGRDGGAAMEALLVEVSDTVSACRDSKNAQLQVIGESLAHALAKMQASTAQILAQLKTAPDAALASSFDYLMQTGYTMGGWHLARSALVAGARRQGGADNPFYEQKMATAAFYAEQILPRVMGHAAAIAADGSALQAYAEEWL